MTFRPTKRLWVFLVAVALLCGAVAMLRQWRARRPSAFITCEAEARPGDASDRRAETTYGRLVSRDIERSYGGSTAWEGSHSHWQFDRTALVNCSLESGQRTAQECCAGWMDRVKRGGGVILDSHEMRAGDGQTTLDFSYKYGANVGGQGDD